MGRHRNLKVINSNITKEESFEIIKKHIINLLEKSDKRKINKIYLNGKLEDFNLYNDDNSRLIKIQKNTLDINKNDTKYVIYKRNYKEKNIYIMEMYKYLDGKKIIYFNKKISFETYLEFISKYKINNIEYYKQLSFIKNIK